MIVTSADETLKTIMHKAPVVNYIVAQWEAHVNRKTMIQCKNCQQWGHATTNCNANPVCLKCARSHQTKGCLVPKNAPESELKCTNCGGHHTANNIVCATYQNRLEYMENKKLERQQRNNTTQPRKFREAPAPATNPWKNPPATQETQRIPRSQQSPSYM
ncbi:hypothetical protein BDFB_006666 [Asbolus verrucosus]|uniref:Nucleic-acid-binding protein from transposon X-element n=1 Tax=Asbolus verrucosus TaxID=1661398 RepID=A0A482WCK9_ASBVE|nr:hypothetical protein BDFB_006666 [Asbolus verrucosus]